MSERVSERRQCACERPDPVMQADGCWYCVACSFQAKPPASMCGAYSVLARRFCMFEQGHSGEHNYGEAK